MFLNKNKLQHYKIHLKKLSDPVPMYYFSVIKRTVLYNLWNELEGNKNSEYIK